MTRQRSQDPTAGTPSKGCPTLSKAQAKREVRHLSARQANLQWGAVIIVGLVIFGLVLGIGTGGGLRDAAIGRHG
jgi:hypothetical protein